LLIITCNVQQAQISNKQNMLIEPCASNYLILYELLKGIDNIIQNYTKTLRNHFMGIINELLHLD